MEKLVTHKVDLILLDIQMPILGGLATCAIIRTCETNGDLSSSQLPPELKEQLQAHCKGTRIPIVAMTANAMEGDREKCLAAGMDSYLTKPFDPAQLRAVLSTLLRKRGKNDAAASRDFPQEGD